MFKLIFCALFFVCFMAGCRPVPTYQFNSTDKHDCSWLYNGDGAARARAYREGFNNGYAQGYKQGYTNSLVNQERGLPHDYILKEDKHGEWRWILGDGKEVYPYISYEE